LKIFQNVFFSTFSIPLEKAFSSTIEKAFSSPLIAVQTEWTEKRWISPDRPAGEKPRKFTAVAIIWFPTSRIKTHLLHWFVTLYGCAYSFISAVPRMMI
jgi:hypothetical protein